MTQKVALVTGANGFIGRSLCRSLRNDGWHVKALLRKPDEGCWDSFFSMDLSIGQVPDDELIGVSVVYHLAGVSNSALGKGSEDYCQLVNVRGTERLLKASIKAKVEHFIFFSSVKAMGEANDSLQDEKSPCKPVSAYGRSKLEAERTVLAAQGVNVTIIRLPIVYGCDMNSNLMKMIALISSGKFPPLMDVQNRRSMVHVEDAINASLLVSLNPLSYGQIYIVTDGYGYSTREIYEMICDALNKEPTSFNFPLILLFLIARAGDFLKTIGLSKPPFSSLELEKLIGSAEYNSSKIVTELGFSPSETLENTIPEMVGYFLK